MDGFEDIIKEFLVESYENLDKLDGDLVALEGTPEDRERLASIFRTVHTIKGTSGFLALPKLERVTHVGENLLVPLRDGELTLTRPIADTLLEMVDAIRAILQRVELGQGEGEEDYDGLVNRLQAALEQSQDSEGSDPADATTAPADAIATEKPDEANSDDVTAKGASDANDASTQSGPAASAPSKQEPSLVDASVRLDVGLLDKLVNLVGELVLARNQIVQFSRSMDDAPMLAAAQRLNQITTELQEGVMKTRMQPIRNAWGKLPRVVRDLAASCGKQIDVRMEGEETEIDKTVLEAIKDPLTHIVRNVIDHGIEPPQQRIACGKRPQGTLQLKAFHEGGQMIIQVIDDGAGIDTDAVRAKAIEKGILTESQAAKLSQSELTNLILLPGFSTASSVTNVSGRGVGMDVVKTNIESIGGTLSIQSEPGKGTTLRIRIPLTLAIIPVLLITADGDRYAIPQVSLIELVHIDSQRAGHEIEFIHDAPMFRLRDRLLPLVYVDEQLGLHPPRHRGDRPTDLNIVVLQSDGRQFGLVVDEITDTQEIVVKPLGHHLKDIPVYAGATIMGDGRVCLILDPIGLALAGGVTDGQTERQLPTTMPSQRPHAASQQSLLIVDIGNDARAAIPLSSVARLEEFSASNVEHLGGFDVVQYHGQTIPLFAFSPSLECQPLMMTSQHGGTSSPLHTVVFRDGNRVAGVVVGTILDILQQRSLRESIADDDRDPTHLVIQGRVTQVIDLKSFLQNALRQWDQAGFAA
ncbi:Chemotaxis protein CheA [Stieleria maiorica]|uniref:histidine kinase n=1 Tax=Stieleria maiorica TaxID=2795974 RepID=A0A5B9MK42_9BACT|nr:chemotaxis protein CheA [Stieleria maiorica]QEG01733.1 Chemotaxis protein CheA [Stieleria maiorica]